MNWQHGVITLTVVSPVFVGSGADLQKTEYILDKRSGKAYVLNVSKFLEFLRKKNLQKSYEKFILDYGKCTLKEWIRDQIPFYEVQGFCDYTLDIGNIDMRQSKIKTFMKDVYGDPYIPGSSLKGAIRTVLLYSLIKNGKLSNKTKDNLKKAVFNRWKNQLNFVSQDIEKLLEQETMTEEENFTDKFMAGFRIGDSDAIPKTNLVLCEKEDYGTAGKKASSRIPLIRECLRPGTEIKFSYVLDKNKFPYDQEEIKRMIQTFFRDYQTIYMNSFPEKIQYPECTICIGGGVGFISKTLIYGIYNKEEALKVSRAILSEQFKKHHHENDSKISPRMRKMTTYHGQLYDMGLCKFSWS